MAFKHVSANRLVFLLSTEGAPSGLFVNGDPIPVGSLAIDRINAKTYQLQPSTAWAQITGGGGGGSTSIFEELTTASTSAPYVYHLGLTPKDAIVQLYVNGKLVYPTEDYTLVGLTITWVSTSYVLDVVDQLVAYYDTTDI